MKLNSNRTPSCTNMATLQKNEARRILLMWSIRASCLRNSQADGSSPGELLQMSTPARATDITARSFIRNSNYSGHLDQP